VFHHPTIQAASTGTLAWPASQELPRRFPGGSQEVPRRVRGFAPA